MFTLYIIIHRYKMSTSGGGGCCDCGDSEAWKEHPNCLLHRAASGAQGAGQVASADLLARIPDEVQARARLVFRSVLKVSIVARWL